MKKHEYIYNRIIKAFESRAKLHKENERLKKENAQLKNRVNNISYHPEGFSLQRYEDADGRFDYEKYARIQTQGNRAKLASVFAQEENIKYLSTYLLEVLPELSKGLCHGTRRGVEQKWFCDYTGADVLGTEISDTAEQFPRTINWDFHEVREDWYGAFDFIYSNSLDHSYDPDLCLNSWISCLKPHGLCIIEHTALNEKSTLLDPFGAPVEVMPYLICKWGRGKFSVREILIPPKEERRERMLVIGRNNRQSS